MTTLRFIALRFVSLAVFALALVVAAPAWAGYESGARQAILLDVPTGTVLYEKNADEVMAPSSMSKLMTTYLLFEKLHDHQLKLTDTLPVSAKAWRMGGSKMFVQAGSRVAVEDLIRGIVVQSGNDACIVVAEGLWGDEANFVEAANRKARALGMTHSTFRNATGWPDPGHVSTARDLAILALREMKDFPEFYHYYSEREFTYNGIHQGNRNPLLYKPEIGADGMKTGHTEAGGYGLVASARRDGRRLLAVINGTDSMNARSLEAQRLLDYGFREFQNYALVRRGDVMAQAPVWLGTGPEVPLVAADDLTVTLARTARPDMKVVAVFDAPVPAPVAKGSRVGKLVVTAPGAKPVEVALLAGDSVPRLGVVGRMLAALRHIVLGDS